MFGKTVCDVPGEEFEHALDEAKRAKGTTRRPRPGRRRPARAGRRVQEDLRQAHRARLPAGPARAARPRHPRGLRLVERRARRALPPPGAHPGRPRHRGQRGAPWSSATSAPTPAPASRSPATRPPARRASTATTWPTPRARTSSPASATPCRCRSWSSSTRRPTTSCCGIMAHAGGALPRPVRHRVHHRARQALDAADPGRQAHRRRRVRHRRPARRRGRDRPRRGAAPGHRRAARPADVPALRARPRHRARSPRASAPPRARPSARSSSTSARAVELAAEGEAVILVRRETNPDDLPGMIAAQGILTSRGGKTSHAAVVARGMGKTCVCGADALEVNVPAKQFTVDGHDRRARATSSRSTAPPARSTSARCRSSRPRWCSTSRATSTRRPPTTRWSRPYTGS